MTEIAMLNRVVFAAVRRIVGNPTRNPQSIRQTLQFLLEDVVTGIVAATAYHTERAFHRHPRGDVFHDASTKGEYCRSQSGDVFELLVSMSGLAHGFVLFNLPFSQTRILKHRPCGVGTDRSARFVHQRRDLGTAQTVNEETCTGCGVCRYVCPAPENAILLMPAFSRPGLPNT